MYSMITSLPRTVLYKYFSFFVILFFLSGCNFVSFYDSVTYKNLTDIKGEMKVAFEDFNANGAEGPEDAAKLEDFKIQISKAMEYEAGKNLNDNTISQFKILYALIDESVTRFKNNNMKLTPDYCQAKWENLEEAFNIAIATERNKIEN